MFLVTGATGFLGQYIVEQLRARGDAVRAFCRKRSAELDALGVETVLGDMTDRAAVIAACRGADAVIHSAGVAGIWGPWNYYYDTNTLGTRYVIEGCRAQGVGRLVYTSSPSVTFDGSPQRGIDESAPYPRRWLCHYPHSKALAEHEVLAAHEPGRLHTSSLRPHLIWGPRDRHLIPRLLDRARRGKLKRVGGGRNLIDVTYVENAAAAHLQAVDKLVSASPVGGRAYFLSQGAPVNCWTWINEVLALAGLEPVRKAVPYPVAYSVGGLMELVARLRGQTEEPLMTRFLAAQLAGDHYFDISRATSDLGYTATVSTEAGMSRLRTWLANRASTQSGACDAMQRL